MLAAKAAKILLTDIFAERVEHLSRRLGAKWPGKLRAVSEPALFECDIIINATPVGLRADDPLPFEVDLLPPRAIVADIIMKPAETKLLKAAAERRLRIHPGTHMLDEQIEMYRKFFRVP